MKLSIDKYSKIEYNIQNGLVYQGFSGKPNHPEKWNYSILVMRTPKNTLMLPPSKRHCTAAVIKSQAFFWRE